nr:SH3 domain-containing protein [uncultured Intestinibacter sp.]
MKEKIISLAISLGLMTTIGFKDLSYADTTVSGIVTATALNVRSGPATTYSVIGQVLQGNDVKIVDKTGNWLKVNYKNTTGYVSGAYVSSIYNEAKTEGYVIGCNTLNVRSGPGTEYARKGSLVNGTKVHIISTSLGWSKIIYNGNYAYVSASYLSNSPSENQGNTGSNNSSNGNNLSNGSTENNNTQVTIKNTGTVTADRLNVRQQPSTSSTILGVLEKNTTVKIVDETESWYKIMYKNDYAFVSKNYIILGGTQTGGTQTVTNLNNFLFIGDSFTSRIKNTIQSKAKDSYVRAKGGAFPSYWLDNFSQMPDSNNVKGVVLLIGINGISRESNLTDTKTLIDKLSKKYSDKTIYVQRVFPVGKGYAGYNNTQVANYNKNRINPFNASIKAYCNTKSNVKFIDTTSGFVDANGFLINCETDGLHILDSYSTKFYNNIQTAVINVQ